MDSNKEVNEKVLHGMVYTGDEIRYKERKRITKIIIFVVVVILLRIFFGSLILPNIFGFPSGYNRYFLVEYNEKPLSVEYKLENKMPIIPIFVYMKSTYEGASYYTKENIENFYVTDEEDIKLSIKTYACFSGKTRVKCDYYENYTKKEKDIEFTDMEIVRTSKPYETVYKGKYVPNIGKYLEKNGHYTINITGKYGRTNAYITTYVIKKDKLEEEDLIETVEDVFTVSF